MSDEPSDELRKRAESLRAKLEVTPVWPQVLFLIESALKFEHEAGRASMQRELEEANGRARALQLNLGSHARMITAHRARIATLEAGQVNAAVDMIRTAAFTMGPQSPFPINETWLSVADWLEAKDKAPREAEREPCERCGLDRDGFGFDGMLPAHTCSPEDHQ